MRVIVYFDFFSGGGGDVGGREVRGLKMKGRGLGMRGWEVQGLGMKGREVRQYVFSHAMNTAQRKSKENISFSRNLS